MNGPLPRVSVIVVSWQRPAHLRLCLSGLLQQDHPEIELVLVLDRETAQALGPELAARGVAARIADNPGENISVARNIGISIAGGEVIAFIDDDAVPEPGWARRLAEVFAVPDVVLASGHVLGRNGISLQWGGVEVDASGADHPLADPGGTMLHNGSGQRAVKPIGTNSAFRAAVLRQAGGFDPAYRFFLEDADIGLRLALRGRSAVVPGAQVHHAFAASDRRRADRVPTDLRQIGASLQVFLRRHADPAGHGAAIERMRQEQVQRVRRHQRAGRLSPAAAAGLLAGFDAGLAEGAVRELAGLAPLASPAEGGFLALGGTGPRRGLVLAGYSWQAPALRQAAAQAVREGRIVTVLCLSAGPRAHRVSHDPGGFWWQSGGLFGRSDRQAPRLVWGGLASRVAAEKRRIEKNRPVE